MDPGKKALLQEYQCLEEEADQFVGIQDIEDLYNVRISIRNRNNELHILCWGTDISARKNCFAHINTKIDKYNM